MGQGLDEVLLEEQNSPGGHLVQFTLPERLYQPRGQGIAAPDTLGQYLPAEHITHGLSGDTTMKPGEQGVQETEPESDTEPFEHD